MRKKTNTMESALIAVEILRRIPRNRKITATELHEQLKDKGMVRHIRTIQRQLEELSECFEIERDDQSRPYGYRWKERAEGLMLPYLSEQESLLLQLAQQQLRGLLPSSMMRSMNGFFEQAQRNLQFHDNAKLAKQWLKKVRVISTTQPLLPPQINPDVFEEVSNALYANCWLHINYLNAKGAAIRAEVMPLGLAQQGVVSYLVCRFKGFSNERSLALHRFVEAKKLELSFEYPADFNLEQYDDSGRFGFGNGQYVQLTLKIKKHAGHHIIETPLSKDQVVCEEDGCYIIVATVVDTHFLDRWLRGFGSDVVAASKKAIH